MSASSSLLGPTQQALLLNLGVKSSAVQTDFSFTMVIWKKPMLNQFKLNCDGASRGNPGIAGGGGALRDDRCLPFLLFHIFMDIAELRALHVSSLPVSRPNLMH